MNFTLFDNVTFEIRLISNCQSLINSRNNQFIHAIFQIASSMIGSQVTIVIYIMLSNLILQDFAKN